MRHRGLVAATALVLAIAPAAPAQVEDNVEGLRRMKEDVLRAVQTGEFDVIGPWNLRYVGPGARGTQVFLQALPAAAFETRRTAHDGHEVRLRNPDALLTRVTRAVRPLGVSITKTYEGVGQGRVYVTFKTKGGQVLQLDDLDQKGLIRSLEWDDDQAVTFIGYVGKEAAFERNPGHANTPVQVLLTIEEEGALFQYREHLPRTGPAPFVEHIDPRME